MGNNQLRICNNYQLSTLIDNNLRAQIVAKQYLIALFAYSISINATPDRIDQELSPLGNHRVTAAVILQRISDEKTKSTEPPS